MSKLPEFLQHMTCFDGRQSQSAEEFLKGFYAREKERRKHMKVCTGCGKWFTPIEPGQEYHNDTCRQKHYSRLYQQQRQELIDEELRNGGWIE